MTLNPLNPGEIHWYWLAGLKNMTEQVIWRWVTETQCGTCRVCSGSNWTAKLIEASLGVQIQLQTLRAGAFNLNISSTEEQPHRSTWVILLTPSFGCLPQLTPKSKLHSTVGCCDPAPDLNSPACSHPASAELQVVKIKAIIIFPNAPKAHKFGRI